MIDTDDLGTNNNLDNRNLILSTQDRPEVGVLGIATSAPFLVTLPGLVKKKKKSKHSMSRQHTSEAWKLFWELRCSGF